MQKLQEARDAKAKVEREAKEAAEERARKAGEDLIQEVENEEAAKQRKKEAAKEKSSENKKRKMHRMRVSLSLQRARRTIPKVTNQRRRNLLRMNLLRMNPKKRMRIRRVQLRTTNLQNHGLKWLDEQQNRDRIPLKRQKRLELVLILDQCVRLLHREYMCITRNMFPLVNCSLWEDGQ